MEGMRADETCKWRDDSTLVTGSDRGLGRRKSKMSLKYLALPGRQGAK